MNGAIVLAGGGSRRMGTDKALLDWNGTPLLQHVIDIVNGLTGNVVVAADRPERFPWLEAPIVPDAIAGAGPLSGILAGLETLGPGRHIVVACDMPLLRATVLKHLIEVADKSFDAVVPRVADLREPLCAVYDGSIAPVVRTYLETGNRSVHGLLDRLTVRYVCESELRSVDPDLRSFLNLNRPGDLAALRSFNV